MSFSAMLALAAFSISFASQAPYKSLEKISRRTQKNLSPAVLQTLFQHQPEQSWAALEPFSASDLVNHTPDQLRKLRELEGRLDVALREKKQSKENAEANSLFNTNILDVHLERVGTIRAGKATVCQPDLSKATNRSYDTCCVRDMHKADLISKTNAYFAAHPQKIPQKIHQIWIGEENPPTRWLDSFRVKFRAQFPGWEYKLWTAKELESMFMLNFQLYKDDKLMAGRADIARLEILHRFGGIYIDADCEWLPGRNLGDLIGSTASTGVFMGQECKMCGVGLTNSVIGSTKFNPLIYYTLRVLKKAYPHCNEAQAYQKTGPFLVDQVLKGFGMTEYPYYTLYPKHWVDDKLQENRTATRHIDPEKFPNSYMYQFGYTTNSLQKVM